MKGFKAESGVEREGLKGYTLNPKTKQPKPPGLASEQAIQSFALPGDFPGQLGGQWVAWDDLGGFRV